MTTPLSQPIPAIKRLSHTRAALQALLVTFIWSTSWVLIKFGLQDLPPLTFAGLRYFLAFLCLALAMVKTGQIRLLKNMSRKEWANLIALGIFQFTVTQGAVFVALAYLPAITVSLLLNFTTLAVVLGGIVFLREIPTRLQWLGVIIFLAGIALYFAPLALPAGSAAGLAAAGVCVLGSSMATLLGRRINFSSPFPALTITTVSMSIGSVLLLAAGLGLQGLPQVNLREAAIILWLAVVNTALTFPLWNQVLRTLKAMEALIINNTMLIQIGILAFLFLGESLNAKKIGGMLLVAAGVLAVQLRKATMKSAG